MLCFDRNIPWLSDNSNINIFLFTNSGCASCKRLPHHSGCWMTAMAPKIRLLPTTEKRELYPLPPHSSAPFSLIDISNSFNQFDFARLPLFVEPGLQRPIKTQCNKPAFSGHRLRTNWGLTHCCPTKMLVVFRKFSYYSGCITVSRLWT